MCRPFQQENASELMHELSTLEKAYSTILRRHQERTSDSKSEFDFYKR